MQSSVFISGANRGLGLSLTHKFLHAGFRVFAGAYRLEDTLHKTVGQFPGQLSVVPLDVSDIDSVRRAAQATAKETSVLDILINNAGIYLERPIQSLEELEFNDSHFQKTMEVNAFGALRMTQQFLPLLDNGKRKIIANISSEAGSIGDCKRTNEFAYCMSKSALNMASKILQNYLNPLGYKILAIHPGWMRTDMGSQSADFHPDQSAEGIYQLVMKPWQLREEIYMDYQGRALPW